MSKPLTDLDPRFVTNEGRRVGVSFACPGCGAHRVFVTVDPPFDAGPTSAKPWLRSGEHFGDLTLRPSIVAYKPDLAGRGAECWHGFVTNGVASP